MKQIAYNFIFGLLACMAATSCSEDEKELNKGNDVLSLSVSKEVVALDVRQPNAEAVAFKWTTGTNQGTGASISYTFQLDVQGRNFSAGINEDMGKGIYSKTYTVNALNRVLLEELAQPVGQEVTLEARIIATVSDERVEEQISPVLTLKVTPFKPVTSTLYLIGGATPNGWAADKATAMNAVAGEAGAFIWSGVLNAGDLKFITTLGDFMPSYNKGADDTRLVLRERDDQPDEKFQIQSGGKYQIKLNVLNLTIDIAPMAGPKYEQLYFVGSFNGWSFEPMMQDKSNPFLFRMGRVMEWAPDGEFKFATKSGSFTDPMYHPTVANAPYSHTAVSTDGTDDRKWVLTEAECGKAYKMVLDISEGAEVFTMKPFTPYPMVYLVGAATAGGWTVADATPMKAVADNPYLFTWTGTLKSGELKFSLDKQTDFGGAWFLAYEDGLAPNGEEQQMAFSPKGDGGNDRKWNITNAGKYTIELDQLKEVVKITKN